MEGVSLEQFNKLKPSTITTTHIHPHLLYESENDAIITAMQLQILLWFILSKWFIASFFTTIWDQKYSYAKYYNCELSIYLLSCISLKLLNIIE